MTAIVSIVGNSDSGKTTLVEKLIPELKSRGYRVATIKHTPHGMTLGDQDTDSWRHLQAGSEATVTSSQTQMVLIKPVAPDVTLNEIASIFGENYDIILAEGFKRDNTPKIEIHRSESGPPLKDIKKLIAIVTDEPWETETGQFSLDDVKGLADLLEEGFIKPRGNRISLYINNTPVPLSPFPKEVITNILTAMASSLKGVAEVESLEIFLSKKD